jgi:sulfatase maturation enzyme AslB (radical SAM superfamily)
MASPTVRALVLASTNDALPDCRDCVYKAWCGQQPEYNYVTQGSLFGRMRDSTWCRKHKQLFDYIAWRLRHADAAERDLYRVWTTRRPQEHFLQDTE